MGKNIVEKILAKTCGRSEVSVGEYLPGIRSNRPLPCGIPSYRGSQESKVAELGGYFDPTKVMQVGANHFGAGGAAGVIVGETRRTQIVRLKEMGVPNENILTMGQGGIEHVVSGEKCWPLPGTVWFSAIDGHCTTSGALGALVLPLSGETVAYLATGYTWIQVPEVAKVILNGVLPKGVTARDVCEYVMGQIGPAGASGQVMEWTGPVVNRMDMDARFTLCVNAIFNCAWTAIIDPDETTISYVKSHTKDSFEPLVSDLDAVYANTFRFEVSKLEPQIVPPPDRTKVFPVSKYEGIKIDRGFIGSCANGRLEDMRIAAHILKGQKVHPGMELNITPGSANVYRECAREGILQIFADAEAYVCAPCCGMCHAHNTPLGSGEVCLSTATHNQPGREGSDKAEIYLSSPATMAASAITGKITDPRNFF